MGSSEDFLVEAKKDLSRLFIGQNICSSFSRIPNSSSTEFARSRFLSTLCLIFWSRKLLRIVLTAGVCWFASGSWCPLSIYSLSFFTQLLNVSQSFFIELNVKTFGLLLSNGLKE